MKNRQWPIRLLWVFLVGFSLFFAVRVYYRVTDDFRLSHMIYDFPHNPNWEIEEKRDLLPAILGQSFYYVGKGAQSYVFVSEDDRYVIKFFKFKHLKPSKFLNSLPSLPYLDPYRELLGKLNFDNFPSL